MKSIQAMLGVCVFSLLTGSISQAQQETPREVTPPPPRKCPWKRPRKRPKNERPRNKRDLARGRPIRPQSLYSRAYPC